MAVVLSAQCEDDLDNLEDIVYIGQGGNDVMVNKHQKMACGDLALKVSFICFQHSFYNHLTNSL